MWCKQFTSRIVVVLVVGLVCLYAEAGSIIYVDDDNCPGPGDGTIKNPYCSIQDAIDAAIGGDDIIVAPGVYYEVINLSGKAINLHSSDGQLVTTIDGTGLSDSVVKCTSNEGIDTVIEGFTITGGAGTDISGYRYGGGMYNVSASPTINNCTFTGNPAFYGGGMYNNLGAPTIAGCTFSSAGVYEGGGIYNKESGATISSCTFTANDVVNGGGIFNYQSITVTISDCTFDGNNALSSGGGVHSWYSDTIVTGCNFINNTGGPNGGGCGMSISNGNHTITGCNFTNNIAGTWGEGAGLALGSDTATVTNCVFSGNQANIGGGLSVSAKSQAEITNCDFLDNWTYSEAGGAMVGPGSIPTFVDCTFSGNSTDHDGGALNTFYGSPIIINCSFTGNWALRDGGAIFNYSSFMETTNCLIIDNSAVGNGGAIYNYGYDYGDGNPSPKFSNCTITGNTASAGGSVYSTDLWGVHNTPILNNCILWNNIPNEIIDDNGAATTVNYSNVQGGWAGAGTNNFNSDPLFVDPTNGDYHLDTGSPCIDAADNSTVPIGIDTDFGGNPRFVDDPDTKDTGNGDPPIVDMGAYELQVAACPWDLDGSGSVGTSDLLVLFAQWGTAGSADFDGSGSVGTSDLLILFANWGLCK